MKWIVRTGRFGRRDGIASQPGSMHSQCAVIEREVALGTCPIRENLAQSLIVPFETV